MDLDQKTRSAKEELPPPIEQLLLSGSRLSQANSSLESSQEDSMFKMSDSLLGVFSDLEPALVEPPRNRKSKMELQLREMAVTNPKAYDSIMRNQQKILDTELDKDMVQQGKGSSGSKEGETGDEIQAGSDERESAEDCRTKIEDAEGVREQSNHSSGDYESFRDLLNPKQEEVEPGHIDTDKRKDVEPVTVVDYPSTGHVEAFTPLAKKPPLPSKSLKRTDSVVPVKLPVLVRAPSQASAASVQSTKSTKSTKSTSSRQSKKLAKSDSAEGKTSVKSLTRRKSHDAEAPEPECVKPTVSSSSKSSKIELVGVQSSQQLERTASTSSKASIHASANSEQKPTVDQEQNPTPVQSIQKTKSISADSFTSSKMLEPSVCLPPHFQRLQQIKNAEASPQTQSSSADKNESNKKNFADSTSDTASKLPTETPLSDLMPSHPPAVEESTIGKGENEDHEDAATPTPIVETSASKLSTIGNFARTGSDMSKIATGPLSTPENVAKNTENPVSDEESVILLKRASVERNKSFDDCQSTTSIASAPAGFPSAQRCPSCNDSSSEATSQVQSTVPDVNVDNGITTVTEVKEIEEPAFRQAEVTHSPKWKTKIQGFFNRSSKPTEIALIDETAVFETEGVGTDVDEDIQLLEDNLEQNDDVDVQVAEKGNDQATPKAAPKLESTGRGILGRPKADSAAGKGCFVGECPSDNKNIQLPEDNLERKDGVAEKVVEEDMKNNFAADQPTPKASSKLKSTRNGIFRRPKAASAAGKGFFGGEGPPEKLSRSPSPDRVSIAASEISLPLTSIEKKDEHFFATATSSQNGKEMSTTHGNGDVHPSTESRAIKVDYRNTKEIEIVNAFKPSAVVVNPSPSSHPVETWDNASQSITRKKGPHGKPSSSVGKGKISRMMARYVHKRSPSPKRKQTRSMADASSRASDDFIEMPNFTEVKIFGDELTTVKKEEASTVEEETVAELVEECVSKGSMNAERAAEALQVVGEVDPFNDQVQKEPKVLQEWLSKVNDFILTGCNQIGFGDDVCPIPPSQKVQDESVTPVHSDIEPVLSGYSKTVEMKIPDSNTDTQETDAVDLPDGADIVDNEREHCRYEECPEPQAENDPPISQVENSIDTEIDCKSSLVDSSKNGLTGSKNIGGSKIRRSLKKSLRGRWKKTQLTVPCPKNMNASTPTSKQDDAGVPDPTTPAPLSVSEIVASLENASYRGSTSKASPGEDDKSVSMLSPHSQDSRTAKIPEKKKVRLFQTGVTRWKVAKLLGAQKHRNAESLARNADVPGKTSSNMEYRTVLAVSDESLNEEEHAAIGDGPHLTPIVENADSDGKGESAGPHEQDPSFESASMDPGNQIITSPTGGTEETGFESTLSILDDHSQDQKTKAVPAKKHRSERTHESGQSAEVSYYRGTFDDDLSNMFMPQPVTGETSKWFW